MKFSDHFELAATDLSNHLSCPHLTQLNRQLAQGKVSRPAWHDPSLDVLIQRGQDHEDAYVNYLKAKGLHVLSVRGQSQDATVRAMQSGADVIVQANLTHGQWLGYADILMKVQGKSKLGDWHYEVQDTKLAQDTRASTILQLCLYTEIVSILQGRASDNMHVVKPGDDFPTEAYRCAEFEAYYRFAKADFERVMREPDQATYPDPVEHCNICRWWQVCDRKRHADDHLSLVAGIRSSHIVELQRQSIATLEAFAKVDKLDKPERGNKESLERRRSQARIQYKGRVENKLEYELLPIEKGRGLNRLPEPDKGDVYFDIEGDAFYEDGGLEYVLGYAYNDSGRLVYERIWSTNRQEEKHAFIRFMQFVTDRRKRFPNLFIYHFAPYEPSAIKRLARVHALYENEVDDILRAKKFIDLHAVFKEALLASVEVYSLKELERFTTYVRKVELHDASVARKSVEVALELHEFQSVPPETVKTVEDYNEDDCLATEALHRWLESLRTELMAGGKSFERPLPETGEASENIQLQDVRAKALFASLTSKLPDDRTTWTDEQKAKWLLAHQIEYFRREDKSAWWEYYCVHELEHDDLLNERKAITGLQFLAVLPKTGRERVETHRYKYPPQELSMAEGDVVVEVNGENIGSIKALWPENYTIDIKKTAKTTGIHPSAIHVSERVDPGHLATSLMNLAEAIDESGLSHQWPYHASKDLLMKRKPALTGGGDARLLPGEDAVAGAVRLALQLDRSVLAIQGPPGSGKTYTGAIMIQELAKAGKKIGITAVSHKVIRNLSEATIKRGNELGIPLRFVHKVREPGEISEQVPPEIEEVTKSDAVRTGLLEGKIACGTAWLWSEEDSREVLDYLFVDEAGQMSLSQVLAASRAAKNLILLGDPQQLEQPQRGAHPEGSDVAALSYILDGHPTMPEGRGLFLGLTRRLHPSICSFTSEIFYEGRLKPLPGLERQIIGKTKSFNGAGLFCVEVAHRGNQNKSIEEVEAIAELTAELLAGEWTGTDGVARPLSVEDILIVAPYNAQVAALIERLPGMRIGTVDKFQGQEAAVVIYSMTSSSVDDAPRGMNFLFNPNRFNVATSRARCLCILVASSKLFEPECRTIDHMRWANILCRYRELSSLLTTGS